MSVSFSETVSNTQVQEKKERLFLKLTCDGKKIQKDQRHFTLVKIPLSRFIFFNLQYKSSVTKA